MRVFLRHVTAVSNNVELGNLESEVIEWKNHPRFLVLLYFYMKVRALA